MPQLKNTFTSGRQNQDLDERLIPEGEYIRGLNIRVSKTESGEAGAIENMLPNEALTNIDFGDNAQGIGIEKDEFTNKIYWFNVSDSGSYVVEWDDTAMTASVVLADTRSEPDNVLNFSNSQPFRITGINIIIDTDNENRYLAWTDNLNPPRFINIERAKLYGENNFGQDEINLIKRPPIDAPVITLTQTSSDQENNIEEQFLEFTHRYIFLDGEKSAYSSFTEAAFLPETFKYDFGTNSNESMINFFSQVDITFNTGSNLVKAVEVLFKESDKDNVYLIQTFNKADQGWADDTNQTITFSNNKIYVQDDPAQLRRYYDNVPLTAQAQAMIGSILVFGNYAENYDLIDINGDDVIIQMSLTLQTTSITTGTPTRTLKSNRDYEIGMVYFDDYLRATTPLTNNQNTIYVPNANCITQNQIVVDIGHLAPEFAEYFRFVVKQSRIDYDVIVPTVFYEDGIYVWILLQGGDVNKVKEGDFLWVKADTTGILDDIVQTKVLEITTQDVNFLEDLDPPPTTIEQAAGTYMKVRPLNYNLNRSDFDLFEFSGYDDSAAKNTPTIFSEATYVEQAIYYGSGGLNDMIAVSALTPGAGYTGTDDIRYIIEIDSTGAPDTFQWSDDDGQTFTTGVAITGLAQALSNGLRVQFTNTTGHSITDNWIVSAKAQNARGFGTSTQEAEKAYAFYPGPIPGDTVQGGAQITFLYSEWNEAVQRVSDTYISNQTYENIEEWFWRDNIDQDLEAQGISSDRIWFRRGTLAENENGAVTFTLDVTQTMVMIILSLGTQNNPFDSRVKVRSVFSIFQNEFNIIFETIPVIDNSQPYYEIGRTYRVSDEGFHLAFDAEDTSQDAITDGQFILPLFNAYAWGNGFESIKIKDNFNATTLKNQTRPVETVEDYRRNVRIADLTWSQPFSQETNFNALNEFNLSRVNFFTELDDEDGSIQKLFAKDTNLVAFQEDKDLVVPFKKEILFDAEGDTDIAQSNNVFGTPRAYVGEFGISTHPESFGIYGNQMWHTDQKRGGVVRLSLDGLTEISNYGLRTFFRNYFRDNPLSAKIGAYDPYHDQYVLVLKEQLVGAMPTFLCGSQFFRTNQTEQFIYNFIINDLEGDVVIQYNVTQGTVDITAIFDDLTTSVTGVSGVGELSFERDTLEEDRVRVFITPVESPAEYQITNVCPLGSQLTIVNIVLSDSTDQGETMTNTFQWEGGNLFSELVTFGNAGLQSFTQFDGTEGSGRFPPEGTDVTVAALKTASNTGNFSATNLNRIGYLISSTVYGSGDVNTILGLATFPAITTTNPGGVPQTDSIEFIFTRPIGDEILYVVWDYSDRLIVANNDSAIVNQGQSVDINVLFNDQVSGEFEISNITAPALGTAELLPDNQIRYTSTAGVGLDVFTYTLENENASDTANVAMQVQLPGGGATTAFNISPNGAPNNFGGEDACEFPVNNVKYHDGANVYPTLGDTIYNDVAGTIPFDGNNLFYAIDLGRTIQIGTGLQIGQVINVWICGAGFA